jgi:hypothetical protein
MTILPTPAKWLLHFLQQGYSPERAFCTGSLAEFAPFAAGRPVFYSENGRR